MKSRERSLSRKAGHRSLRLESLILSELISLLHDEIADPALVGVRPIEVQLSPDASHARVGYIVVGSALDEQQAKQRARSALDRATGFLRSRLASALDLKRTPDLGFVFIGVSHE